MASGRRRASGSASRRRPRPPRGPRSLAIEAVRRVTDQGAYSNRVLPSLLERASLQSPDRSLATEMAYGTLRRLVSLDAALEPLLARPLRRAPASARAALRVGAYQLLHMSVPAHAAVSETVGATPPRERGFVNAVLRRLAAEGWEPPGGSGPQAISLRTGVAPWAVQELEELLGEEAEAAAAGLAEPAGLTIRANPCRGSAEELDGRLRGAGLHAVRGALHPGSFRLPGGDPREIPGWDEGRFAVQDEASSWVVDVLEPGEGDRVLDCCAAPGGKAADAACRAGTVVASDLSERRTGLVVRSAERLGVSVRALVQDARRPALRPGFDRVLVDAPCSGLGTARRRPELLWRPSADDPERLRDLQVGIASAAASLLRPGGTLVYSVCTFPRAETDAVVRALRSDAGLEPSPFRGPEGEETAEARLWPHRHGTDAMYVARLVRPARGSG